MQLKLTESRRLTESRVHLLARDRCPFCHDPVTPTDEKAACSACMAWQHAGCWMENDRICAACSLELSLPIEPRATGRRRASGRRLWRALRERWNRVDVVFAAAVLIWTVAGALVGLVTATWLGSESLVWLGGVLGLVIGLGGGLVLLGQERRATRVRQP